MLGLRLKQLRLEKEQTQKQIADLLNITTSSYGFYEQNKRTPDIEMLKKIAEYFNVSLDYLLGTSDIRNPYNLTPEENNNIEEVIVELRKKLLNTKNLKFDGKLATKQDIETILDSVRIGMEMAKIKKRRNE